MGIGIYGYKELTSIPNPMHNAMKNRVTLLPVLLLAGAFLATGCKQSMVITDVDYAQPIETVLQPDSEGMVHDRQHGLSFSILPLQYAETGDSASVTTGEVRMIRSRQGFYYLTASSWKNVYLFQPDKSSLRLERRIFISEEGIRRPAFNQREPHIELINRESGESYRLSIDGIVQPESKTAEEAG